MPRTSDALGFRYALKTLVSISFGLDQVTISIETKSNQSIKKQYSIQCGADKLAYTSLSAVTS